jgi:hypothetical protein
MTAARFLELFRRAGGDAFLGVDGRPRLAGPRDLVEACRPKAELIGRAVLISEMQGELAAARERLRARGIDPRAAA